MISIPGRIPVFIHPFFWLLAFFIGALASTRDANVPMVAGTLVWVLVILISLLIHEFGHALTAMAFRQKAQIHLVAFGGVTVREGPRLKGWQEFLVVLNGPMSGISAFVVARLVHPWLTNLPPLSTMALEGFVIINLFWSLLNLLPILPLDGGRLVAITLEGVFGVRGIRYSYISSMLLAVVSAGLLFSSGQLIIGAVLLLFAFESLREYQVSRSMSSADRDESMLNQYKHADQLFRQGDIPGAVELLRDIREKAKKGLLYTEATIQLALVIAQGGEVEEPFNLLLPVKDTLPLEAGRLFQELAFQMGEWRLSLEAGEKVFHPSPDPQVAFMIALCQGRLGHEEATVGWLKTARREGMENLVEALSRAEFDEVRHSEPFQALKRELEGEQF